MWLAGSFDHSETNENVLQVLMIHSGFSPSSCSHCCVRFLKTRKQDCAPREGEVVTATSLAQQQLEQPTATGIKQIGLNLLRLNQRDSASPQSVAAPGFACLPHSGVSDHLRGSAAESWQPSRWRKQGHTAEGREAIQGLHRSNASQNLPQSCLPALITL